MSSFLDLKTVTSALGGDGVVSDGAIPAGTVVMTERPLFCQQTMTNKQNTLVCGYCFRFVGSVRIQMALLSRQISRVDVIAASAADIAANGTLPASGFLSPVLGCDKACGEIYCSEFCRQAHWRATHNLTCTGHITDAEAEGHPLIQFKTHAITTNEVFLLVADVFAVIANEVMASAATSSTATTAATAAAALESTVAPGSPTLALLCTYVREQWWDAAVAPPGTNPRELKMTLKRLVLESWRKLVKAYLPVLQQRALELQTAGGNSNNSGAATTAPNSAAVAAAVAGLDKLLSSECMSRTIGMFEQNNVGVRLDNPVATFIEGAIAAVKGQDHVGSSATAGAGAINSAAEAMLHQLAEGTARVVAVIEQEGEDEDEDCCMVVYDDDDEEDEEVEEQGEGGGVMALGGALPEGAAAVNCSAEAAADLDRFSGWLDTYEALGGYMALFPPLDGTAFYRGICKVNHSCEPNVKVVYGMRGRAGDEDGGLVASLVAVRDIAAGEELVQSYINQFASFAKRKAALADYGFLCRCPKCRREGANANAMAKSGKTAGSSSSSSSSSSNRLSQKP